MRFCVEKQIIHTRESIATTSEYFTLPMDHPISIENIRRHLSPVRLVENAFSPEQIEWIWKQAFTYGANRVRYNKNGTILVTKDLVRIYAKLKDRFDYIVGPDAAKSPAIGGNFFITPQQYGLHNDSNRPENYYPYLEKVPLNHEQRHYTPWKNVLIPLFWGSHLPDGNAGQVSFFKQRHIDWSHVYNNGNSTTNVSSVYTIADDYSKLQFHDELGNPIDREKNKIPFDQENFKKYMNTPYKRVEGLVLEKAVDWEPGKAIIFDAVQLHCSNEGSKPSNLKMWNLKMGIFLTFLKPLDEDLEREWRSEQEKMN